jgi:Ca-activated chloride channel family protein
LLSKVGLTASSLLAAAVVSGMILHADQRPSFRSDVELISLMVSVTGPGGRYVSGLSADDFEIFEDGRPQELGYFAPANTALSVSLLLDSSSSMEESMPLAQKAAIEFVARLRTSDVAQVVNFDSRVEVLQPFTNNRALLETAIQRTHAGGSTSLYNAVYITLRQFEKMRGRTPDEIRREVIVVLSDGEDTSSLVTFDELLDTAKRSQTVIYTIGLGLEDPAGRPTPTNGEFGLRRLAQETGGRLFRAKRPEDLSNVYTQIADELTSQYVLGYLSRNERRDAGWRSITVSVHRPQLQARTRAGYYATARTKSP